MDFKRKEEIEQIRRKYGHQLSSHAFDSLWIWKEKMGLTIYQETDFFMVKSTVSEKMHGFFHVETKKRKKDFSRNRCKNRKCLLCFI